MDILETFYDILVIYACEGAQYGDDWSWIMKMKNLLDNGDNRT